MVASEKYEINSFSETSEELISERKMDPDKAQCWLCGTQQNVTVCQCCKGQSFCPSCKTRYHDHPKRKDHHSQSKLPALIVDHRLHVSLNQKDTVEGWICSHCTLENPNDVHICEACGKTSTAYIENSITVNVTSTVKMAEAANSQLDLSNVAKPQKDVATIPTWTCTHCSYPGNNRLAELCLVCEHATNPAYILKDSMTEEVTPATVKMTVAAKSPQAPLEVAEAVNDVQTSTWTCVHCTIVNDGSAHICIMCSKASAIHLERQQSRNSLGKRRADMQTEHDNSTEMKRRITRFQAEHDIEDGDEAIRMMQKWTSGSSNIDSASTSSGRVGRRRHQLPRKYKR